MEALATEAGKLILAQGVLGVIVVILGGAVIHLYKELQTCQSKLFSEYGKIIDSRESLGKALTANSLALEANNRAMEARTAATLEMARQIEGLSRTLDAARQQGSFDAQTINRTLDDIKARLGALDR